jgi:hypothetical protein
MQGGVTVGSVKKVDVTGRRITLTPRKKGEPDQNVDVPADATLVRLNNASSGEVRVGDTISVFGIPLVMDARQIRIGDEPIVGKRPPRAGGPAATPQPKIKPKLKRPSKRPAPAPPPPPGSGTRLFGRVIRINPLVVSLQNGGPTFEVRTNRSTHFTRAVRITLTQIKVGDPLMVFGKREADGSLEARRVQVGLEGLPFTRAAQ